LTHTVHVQVYVFLPQAYLSQCLLSDFVISFTSHKSLYFDREFIYL